MDLTQLITSFIISETVQSLGDSPSNLVLILRFRPTAIGWAGREGMRMHATERLSSQMGAMETKSIHGMSYARIRASLITVLTGSKIIKHFLLRKDVYSELRLLINIITFW